jgi:hypothetical protein
MHVMGSSAADTQGSKRTSCSTSSKRLCRRALCSAILLTAASIGLLLLLLLVPLLVLMQRACAAATLARPAGVSWDEGQGMLPLNCISSAQRCFSCSSNRRPQVGNEQQQWQHAFLQLVKPLHHVTLRKPMSAAAQQ